MTMKAFYASYAAPGEKVDVVVFAAPQLSLFELQRLADLIGDKRIHPETSLLVATSPEIKGAADRMGLTAKNRTVRRDASFRRLLLSKLCARNGGGERVETADVEFSQAD